MVGQFRAFFSLVCELSDKHGKRLYISSNLQRACINRIETHVADQPGCQFFGAPVVAAVHQTWSIGLAQGYVNAENTTLGTVLNASTTLALESLCELLCARRGVGYDQFSVAVINRKTAGDDHHLA